jgi:transcriptional regulator with XRE-family HTH domain
MRYNHHKIRGLVLNSKPRKLTIKALAGEIGISLASLDKIKDGKNEPSIEALVKIATYFKKDINYFFDYDPTELEAVNDPKEKYGDETYWKCEAILYKRMYDDLIEKLVLHQPAEISKHLLKKSG